MLVGGAIGNLIDRIANGAVTDFIKLPHWPAFNVADMSITFGVLTLLWVLEGPREASARIVSAETERDTDRAARPRCGGRHPAGPVPRGSARIAGASADADRLRSRARRRLLMPKRHLVAAGEAIEIDDRDA